MLNYYMKLKLKGNVPMTKEVMDALDTLESAMHNYETLDFIYSTDEKDMKRFYYYEFDCPEIVINSHRNYRVQKGEITYVDYNAAKAAQKEYDMRYVQNAAE